MIALTGANPQIIEFGDEYIEQEATATDRVDDDLELTGRIVIAGDEVITDRVGEYTVTYDVSDAAGNPAEQKTRTVRVTDTTAPDITAPEPYATEAIAEQTPLTANDHYGTATSSDRSARITSTAPATFPLGDTIITWTATDANDLSSTAEQTIRITDTTKPDITAPANVSTEATAPTTPVAVGQAAATDLVDNALEITRNPQTNDFAVGEHAITWKATDASGNEETDTQTITIADTTAPEITLTGAEEQTIEFGDGYAELKATATDLVDGDLTGSIAIAGTVNTDRVGQYTVTYDVSDTAGNAAVQKTRTVIVEDTMKPGITVPEPYATEATATLTPLGRDEYGIATSTDGDITDDAPATFPVGDTIIIWTATDANGLSSTAEQTIRIADTTKPDITAPANVSKEATGPTTPVAVGQATATDLVDNALEITRNPQTNDFAVGEHTITWKATDASGNFATATQTVTITDTTQPVIALTGANPQIIEFGDEYIELEATATDRVDDDLELTGRMVIAGDEVITDRVGEYTVTYDVSDAAGNPAEQKTRTVRVTDTTAPGITAPEPYATEAIAEQTPLTANDHYGTATSSDRSARITSTAPATFPLGDTIIIWTATDANGLSSTAEQTIRITDTTKPDITAPANVSTEATGPTTSVAVGQAAATDLADNALKITRSPETNDFAVGEHAITWKATDASGNEETDTQTITIADTTAPEITLTGAEEQTIEFGDGYAELKATATDLVDGDLTGSIAIAGTVNTDRVGQYTVTYDVSDTAGNAAVQKTRTVIVEDTMKPGITVPEPYATEATATLTPLGRDEYGIATSTDGDITDDAPEDFPVGDTIITWTATDANDLSSTAEQTIRITDTTKPDITAPANVSTEATAPTTPVAVGQAAATDLVDNALEITRNPQTNDFAVGEHTITWKATDASGNFATATQTVAITDTTAPVIALTGANPQIIEFGDEYIEQEATATDRVDDDLELTGRMVIAGDEVITDRVGEYTVTYDVSDAAGNPAEQKTRTVRVTDTTAPDITAPEPYATEAIAEQTPLTANDHYGTATSSDRSARITSTAPATFPLGDTIIIWTATDANGLSSTAEQTIRITDTTKPDITAPANVSTEATAPTTPVAVGQAAATDLVDNALEITRNPQTNGFAVGEHAITWKATDASGNFATATQTVTITDTTKPVIALTGANPQIIEFGDEYIELEATATDRVDDDLELTGRMVIAGDEVITDRVGEYTVTYDVSDAAGNPAEQKTRTVRVTDTTAPGITAPALYATEAIAEQTPLTANDHYGTATSSDRSARITSTTPATFPLGDTIIIWTATDANGLSSTAEQTIRITDTTKPVITAPEDVSKEATGPTTPVAVGQAAATDLADNALKITRSPETNDFAVGEHAITWKATDASGNEETDTQTITIADTTAPEITLTGAEEQTIEFGDGYAELKATATDLVDGDLTGSIAIAGTVNTDRVGQYTVTYDVSDTAGNAAVQKTRTVIVEDTMKPGITVPEPYATEATATLTPLGRDEYGIATSTDGDITDDAPATFPVGDTIITWTATDANGLSSTAEQTITIADRWSPGCA